MPTPPRIVLYANTDWYLYNFRLDLARSLRDDHGAEVWMLSPDGPFRPRLEAEGFRWRAVSLSRQGLNPLQDLASARQVARHLRELRPDLLHTFTLKAIVTGTLAAWWAGTPRVVNAVTGLGHVFSEGNEASHRRTRALLEAFFRATFRSDRIRTIFQNPHDLDRLAPRAPGKARCRLVGGSGIDTRRFSPPPSRSGPPLLLLASRLLREKGIQTFCEAADLVRAAHPEAAFAVAGTVDPGNPASFLPEEIEALKRAHPQVAFLGHCEDMPGLYQRAHAAVLPSAYAEGVPRSLLEAAACGLPLIAADGPGIRSVVHPGATGLLVPPGDARGLAEAMVRLLEDVAFAEACGAAGRALVESSFSIGRVLAGTFSVYRELGLPLGGAAREGDQSA